MKSDALELVSTRTVGELGRLFQDVMRQIRAASVEPIQSGSGALAAFDDRADIEIVAEGKTLIGGFWAVQVFVVDQGADRAITLVAVGDGGFTRAWGGARNTYSLSASVKKRDEIAAAIQ